MQDHVCFMRRHRDSNHINELHCLTKRNSQKKATRSHIDLKVSNTVNIISLLLQQFSSTKTITLLYRAALHSHLHISTISKWLEALDANAGRSYQRETHTQIVSLYISPRNFVWKYVAIHIIAHFVRPTMSSTKGGLNHCFFRSLDHGQLLGWTFHDGI